MGFSVTDIAGGFFFQIYSTGISLDICTFKLCHGTSHTFREKDLMPDSTVTTMNSKLYLLP